MHSTEIDLYKFHIARLPKVSEPFKSKPCLAEEWFVEDALPCVGNYVTKDELRKIWRVARLQRLGLFSGAGCPRLLLHQMTQLLPELFTKALQIFEEQSDAQSK